MQELVGNNALEGNVARVMQLPGFKSILQHQQADIIEAYKPTSLEVIEASRIVGCLLVDSATLSQGRMSQLAVEFYRAACKTVNRVKPGPNLQILQQLYDRGLMLAIELRRSGSNEEALAILDLMIEAKTDVAHSISDATSGSLPPKPA